MSIANDKALNLGGAKILYDDLRGRINSCAPEASPEFTGSISLGRASGSDVGAGSVAIGGLVEAAYDYSAAFGVEVKASGTCQFAFGKYNQEIVIPDWISGTHYYIGDNVLKEIQIPTPPGKPAAYKIARCECITENSDASFDESKWNIEINFVLESDYAEIVGNGEYGSPSNARALDWSGNERLNGDLYVNCNADSTGGNKVISDLDIMAIYTGVSEYTPAAEASFASGVFYHQAGAKYIGMLKGNYGLEKYMNSGTYQIPSESDNDWDIMYFGDPRLKEAMIFPIPGIIEYTPAETYSLNPNYAYHEVGSKYIVVAKDNKLRKYSASGAQGVSGNINGGADPVIHLPIESTTLLDVYTIGDFLSAWRTNRVSKSIPIISDALSIEGATLSREQLLTLLGLANDSNAYATPPETIKLGSTTLTETQLQSLLALLN